MKHNIFAVVGGILEILAGVIWLAVSLWVKNIAEYFGFSLDLLQIIVPIIIIFYGIKSCTRNIKKSDLTTFAVLNLVFIGLQLYYHTYVGLGIIQICLLVVASLLYLFSRPNDLELEQVEQLKKYKSQEPEWNKSLRKVFTTLTCIFVPLIIICITIWVIMTGNDLFSLCVFLAIFFVLYLIAIISMFIKTRKENKYGFSKTIKWNIIAYMLTMIIVIIGFTIINFNGSTSKVSEGGSVVPPANEEIIDGGQIPQQPTIVEDEEESNTKMVLLEFAVSGCASIIYLALILGTYNNQYKAEIKEEMQTDNG